MYSKKNRNEISCSCYVFFISFVDEDKRVIDKIVVGTNGKQKLWSIYPTNHYIFLYNKHKSKGDCAKTEKLKRETGFNELEYKNKKKVSNEQIARVMKREGKTQESIKEYLKLNTNIDGMLFNHDETRNNNSNKKYMNVQRKKLSVNELDDFVDDIIKYNPSKSKKKISDVLNFNSLVLILI